MRNDITARFLRSVLSYSPETGEFRHLTARTSRIRKNFVAGTKVTENGVRRYITITINNKAYRAHRLAWLYMTGRWPTDQIDHRDLNPFNNKWRNLREATHTQNQHNRRCFKISKSGKKGIRFKAGKWEAWLRIKGRHTYLGRFPYAADAARVHAVASIKYRGEFARLR